MSSIDGEMVIDCHGHYTTVPQEHATWSTRLKEALEAGEQAPPYPAMSDEEIRDSIESNQLKMIRDRGIDVVLLSPRASAMVHHVANAEFSVGWAQACNDIVARVCDLFPGVFFGVCQLPQTPQITNRNAVVELERCVSDLGFVGCNLNPDPSGGRWNSPPLTDSSWYPLYEKLIELDVPVMVHPSASRTAALHSTGAHYINADTAVFMQLISGDVFDEFPSLRVIIPHGGGAVPYHWGRYRGLAASLGRESLSEHVRSNIYFDTCVYHQEGMELLFRTVECDQLLFGSEMIGAVRGVDPLSGHHYDDTKRYVDALALPREQRQKVLWQNACEVYSRLGARLRGGESAESRP